MTPFSPSSERAKPSPTFTNLSYRPSTQPCAQLGVWYTPAEVVSYGARVDKVLKDLGIPDGLAGENVYPRPLLRHRRVPEVLRVAANLQEKGLGALWRAGEASGHPAGLRLRDNARPLRGHLQVGLTMQELGAPLSEDIDERAGVFLTNALTGWEPTVQKPLPFPDWSRNGNVPIG